MRKPLHKKIYNELADEFGLPVNIIEKICDSQFAFTKEVMMSGKDEQVRLQYLGLFQVKPGRRHTVMERRRRIWEMKRNENNKEQ